MTDHTRAASTRRFTFSAGHRYWVESWSREENERFFGRLTVPHGHNYTLDVTVRGPIDAETGMVIDLKHLKDIVSERVVDHVDHRNLNEDVPFLHGIIPTAENLARAFWRQIAPAIDHGELHEIVLQETEKNSVSYRGEDER